MSEEVVNVKADGSPIVQAHADAAPFEHLVGIGIPFSSIISLILQYGLPAVLAVIKQLLSHDLTGLTVNQILGWLVAALVAYVANPTNPTWPPFPA